MFLLTESIATRGALDVPSTIIANGSFHNGKFYIWAEVGQALVALPFYGIGAAITHFLNVLPELRTVFLKAVVGSLNAFVGALVAVFMFSFCRCLGYSLKVSLFLTVGICLGTFAFPYFKSFTRDPLLMLYLLATVYCLHTWKASPMQSRWLFFAGCWSGLALLTKITFAVNIPFFILYIIVIHSSHAKASTSNLISQVLFFIVPVFFGALGILLYNFLRFQTIFELGYKGGTTFPTPLYVGFFGLLFSPGKSFFFYGPLTILALVSIKRFSSQFKWEAILFGLIFISNLVLYATYIAWAGDGSWGPRYLVPLLPFAVLPIGIILDKAKRMMRIIARFLIVLGVLIQIGGLSIYAGNYLREIGEFPYQRSFDDPEFLYKAHFIPNYSPIVGHWNIFVRNLKEHLQGNAPRINFDPSFQEHRIPLPPEEQKKLLHTFDYWFCYVYYAGKGGAWVLVLFFALATITSFEIWLVRKIVRQHGHQDTA